MKGIHPFNNNGSITIQFQLDGQTYKFSPIRGAKYRDPVALGKATAIAAQISLDISLGNFDPTLQRYRLQSTHCTPDQAPSRQTVNALLLTVWDSWVESLDLTPQTKADHYEMIRRMILKGGVVRVKDTSWLNRFKENLAPSTFNKRLGYLRSCLQWAIETGLYVGANPYRSVKPLKNKRPTEDRIKPFSKAEIVAILEAFNQQYPEYSAFVRFLFFTGVRTGEAIALQWKHVSFEYMQITIAESLSVDRAGNGYDRVRKSTKTGTVRYLPINEALYSLLQVQSLSMESESDLVFPSPTGKPIDPGRFRRFVWKPILESLGLEYRNLYQTRHTLLTHAVMDPAIGILGAAKIAGHKDSRMVTQHYARFIGQPELPSLSV